MGRSQGESGVFFNRTDVADHEAVIDWAARQPWCDGNVVLFGTSYYAMVQPLVASAGRRRCAASSPTARTPTTSVTW